ncbi:scarecrow-like protein 28 [Chenopodium quinoa]|uniref:scarecrow-like protein 28 n=1 Tax=Chenopodium quinoa TaxID=63459 RepID=UPI000B77135E|nr:scarecrow-like protein 28 [Chenopodium quinoa]
MLAGCSSTLLSPRHRLRSEASACHYPLPSMSTQRLDLPCNFSRKEVSVTRPPQSIRGLSVEKPIETKGLKQTIKVPPSPEGRREIKAEFWGEKGKNLKRRFSDQGSFEEDDDEDEEEGSRRKKGRFDFGESEGFWMQQPGFGAVNYPQLPFSISCSGEEERRVCFGAPTDVVSPPPLPPLSHNPWIGSGVTEITEYGEPSHGPVTTTTSGSSSSSESHSLGLRLNENVSEHEYGNGSVNPNPGDGSRAVRTHNDDDHTEQQGFELVSFLMSCVEGIASRNVPAINHFIAKLGEQASPRGRSTISRLTAYFTEALALRVTRLWPRMFHISVPRELDRFDDESGAAAFRLLNQISPIPKFIHFTANEMLLRAFEGKDKVHVIDFDVKQGLQWPGFFQSLATRRNPPSHVRITGIGESKQELVETGERLASFAEAFNLPFEFHPVVDRLEDVRLWMLHVKEGESVAANCILQLHKTLYDANNGAFRDFMGIIRSTNPIALVMAEQEAEHNEPTLEMRVCNSLRYYSAIFDSIDSSLPFDSPARVKIEEMFGREIRNIVACEGSDRIERNEKFGNWKRRMEQEGFRGIRRDEREVFQSQMLLKMYSNERYNVEQQGDEGITLRWMDQPLYTVSLWGSVDAAAGSSSSFSQPI